MGGLLRLVPLILAVTLTSATTPTLASARQGTSGAGSGAPAAVAGQAQCGRPVSERTGNWLCPATAAAQPQPAWADNGEKWYCTTSGCWYVSSVAVSEYEGTANFGYGSRQLGTVKVFFQVRLNGVTSVSKPVRFESTIGVRDLVMEGNRFYYDHNWPQGHAVSPSVLAHHSCGNVNGGKQAQWTPNGYLAHPDPVYVGSVWHQWSWQIAGYPGTWYYYATSVLIHRIGHGDTYHFGDDNNLGQNPAGGGWISVPRADPRRAYSKSSGRTVS